MRPGLMLRSKDRPGFWTFCGYRGAESLSAGSRIGTHALGHPHDSSVRFGKSVSDKAGCKAPGPAKLEKEGLDGHSRRLLGWSS